MNHVLVYGTGVFDDLFIRVYSYTYLLLGGDPPFVLEDSDGKVLYDPVNEGAYVNILRKEACPLWTSPDKEVLKCLLEYLSLTGQPEYK